MRSCACRHSIHFATDQVMDNNFRSTHSLYEDLLALLTASGFVSLGIFLLFNDKPGRYQIA